MKNFFLKSRIILIVFFIFITLKSNSGISAEKYEDILIGDRSSPIKIIVYSSLTCPHCANFHINVLPKIKKHYIDKKKVIVILKDFPLDVAALNASKLIQCASPCVPMFPVFPNSVPSSGVCPALVLIGMTMLLLPGQYTSNSQRFS